MLESNPCPCAISISPLVASSEVLDACLGALLWEGRIALEENSGCLLVVRLRGRLRCERN